MAFSSIFDNHSPCFTYRSAMPDLKNALTFSKPSGFSAGAAGSVFPNYSAIWHLYRFDIEMSLNFDKLFKALQLSIGINNCSIYSSL